MKQIWTGRAAQAAAKYGEHAPMAAVCCNACRTCVQTNVLGIAAAAAVGAAAVLAGFARRVIAKPS
jgi:hypothetical protein